MTKVLQTFRGYSGSQPVFYTNEQVTPPGLTNTVVVSTLRVEPIEATELVPFESWTLNGDAGLTGSQEGILLSLASGTKIFAPGPVTGEQSVFFNGSTRLSAPVTASLQITGSVTLSAYIYPVTSPSSDQYPVSVAESGETSATNLLYSIRLQQGNRLVPLIETGGGSNINVRPSPDFSIAAGRWNHVVYSRDENSTNYLFVDGEQIHSGTEGGPSGGSSTFLSLGRFANDTLNFTGYVSRVKIFDRFLTPNEVKAEYNSVLGNR